MSLLDGQFAYRGLTFGAGTPYGIRRLEGLEDLTVRSSARPLPRGHGSIPGPAYAAAKDVVVELVLRGDHDSVGVPGDLAQLRSAFTVGGDPEPLTWKRPGRPERLIYVKPSAFTCPEEAKTVDVVANPKVGLAADDPRIYSSSERMVTLDPYSATQRRSDYGTDYPKDFSGTGGIGVVEATVTNAGSADAYPLVRFYGPTDGGIIEGVALRNVTTGQTQTVAAAVAAGQILTVDNASFATGAGRQVVGLNGATRYGDWQRPRTPFALPPGDSLLRFTVTGSALAAKCLVTWRDTWLP